LREEEEQEVEEEEDKDLSQLPTADLEYHLQNMPPSPVAKQQYEHPLTHIAVQNQQLLITASPYSDSHNHHSQECY